MIQTIKSNRQLWDVLKGMIPILILSNMATMLGSFVDGIVVGGGLGDQAMSSMGLCIPISYLATAIAGIFSTGTQTRCAKAVGNGDVEGANRFFNTSMGFLFVIGAVLAAVIIVFADPISELLGAKGAHENLKPELVRYLLGTGLSIPFICLTNTLSSLLYIKGKKKIALTAIVLGTSVNIVVDLLSVYILHIGMLGIGLATAFGYIVSAGMLMTQFIGKSRKDSPMYFNPASFSFRSFGAIFKVGSSMAIVRVCHMLRTWIINMILATAFTQAAIAAFSIMNTLSTLVTCVSVGAGAAALTVGSVFIGEKNLSGLKSMMRMAVLWGVVLSLLVSVVCILARTPIVSIYSDSEEVIKIAERAFMWYLISLPFYSINMVFMMFFQGIARVRTAIFICIFDNLLFVCLAALILSHLIGVDGAFIAFPVGEICSLIALVVMAGIYHGKPVRHFDDMLQLREKPGFREQVFECRDIEEIMNASRSAGDYAKGEGADEKTATVISLCIEEYGKNVMEWAFQKKKQFLMSVRLYEDEGRWKIYLKDMGKQFDPMAWMRNNETSPQAAGEHIGIRLTAGMASEIKYVQALGMNTVIITV